MGIKINQYPNESGAFNREDYYDVDAYVSAGVYQSKKQKGGVIQDALGYGLFSQTNSVTVGNTTTETTIVGTGEGSLTIPANYFKKGMSFHAKFGGNISSLNNQAFKINIYEDANLIATTGDITLPTITAKAWELELDFVVQEIGASGVARLVTSGQFIYNKDSNNIFEGSMFNSINTTTFNTTTTATLDVKVKWGEAHVGNTVTSSMFYLTKVK